jgi:cbb3-type cytochrome oxidase cytochrome c subunit
VAILFVLFALLVGAFGFSAFGSGSGGSSITNEVAANVPEWAQKQGLTGNAQFVAGANLFAESGCTNCHTYLGSGSSNLGAPDLSTEGTKGHSVSYFVRQMKCPSCVTHGSSMPSFGALGPKNLRLLALFLSASKRGG